MENVSSVCPTGKFPEKVENLKRQARFSGWNIPNGIARSIYTFLVVYTSSRSTAKKHLSRPVRKTKWLPPSLHSCTSAQFVFLLPPPNDQRHTGKTVQRIISYRKHSARKPLWNTSNSCPVTGFGICFVHG